MENKRHERVMARIRRWAKYYVPKLKERVKTKAADTINNFLTDSNAAARLLNALQQYRTNGNCHLIIIFIIIFSKFSRKIPEIRQGLPAGTQSAD